MDTSNFQDLGENPTQNISNEFQAGEFAQSSDLSPVASLPAATYSNADDVVQLFGDSSGLSRCTATYSQISHDDFCIDCSCNQYNPDSCCLSCVHYFDNRDDMATYAQLLEQKIAAITHYFPALRNITTRELFYIAADSSFVLHPALGVSFLTNQEATSFLTAFRAEHLQFNYSHTSVIKSVKVQAVHSMSEYMQSDENGCEFQYKQDALDAKRYRWLKEQDIALIDMEGVFGGDDLSLNPDDLDSVIDKAMEVL